MRAWQIIVASAASATAASVLLFWPSGVLSLPGLAELASAEWPAIAVLWLAVYGLAAATLTIVSMLLNFTGVIAWGTISEVSRERYVRLLFVTQFFTAIAALFVLAVLHIPVHLPSPLALHTASFDAPAAPIAAGLLALLGVLGWLVVELARQTHTWRQRRHAVPPVESAELRLLREIVSILRQALHDGGPQAADSGALAEVVERLQRPMLEAIKDLATAVNRRARGLRQELEEIKAMVRERDATALPEAIETALKELRETVMSLHQAIDRLQDLQAQPLPGHPEGAGASLAPTSAGNRAQLSAELRELLSDMTPAAEPGSPAR